MATRWQCSPLDDDVLQAPPWIQSSLYITGAAPAGEHLNRVGTHHHLGGACPSASATQHALPLHVFVPPNAKQMAPGASAWRQADLTPRPGRTGQALLRVHLQRLRSRDASDSVHKGRLLLPGSQPPGPGAVLFIPRGRFRAAPTAGLLSPALSFACTATREEGRRGRGYSSALVLVWVWRQSRLGLPASSSCCHRSRKCFAWWQVGHRQPVCRREWAA